MGHATKITPVTIGLAYPLRPKLILRPFIQLRLLIMKPKALAIPSQGKKGFQHLRYQYLL